MKKIRVKIKSILLLGIFCCVILGSFNLNVTPPALNSSNRFIDVRTAQINQYISDLNIIWGGDNEDYSRAIILDNSGNIYITGDTTSFGAGNYDVFIAKYDNSGNLLWNTTWGGSSVENGRGIALDQLGNVYITGETSSFGAGSWDAFIVKYDNSGNFQWEITWGGVSQEEAYDIVSDDLGNVFITGRTQSFGAGENDVFIVKFDNSSNFLWNKTWGGSNSEIGQRIDSDDFGNIYITGITRSFGAGDWDAFILNFDNSGNFQWYTTWGGTNSDSGYDIALDELGNLYIVGITSSYGVGNQDVFIVKYNSSGIVQWDVTWGDTDSDRGLGLSLDNSRNIYVTGERFIPGGGDIDNFILKYNNSGTLLWNKTWDNGGSDMPRDIVVDASENIYITGYIRKSSSSNFDAFIMRFIEKNITPFPYYTPFPWYIIIIIIILSAIGITLTTGYVTISRKKKKKEGAFKPLKQKEPFTRELSTLHDEESRQEKKVKPQITPDMLTPIKPLESKVIQKAKPPKSLSKKKKQKVEEKVTIQEKALKWKELEKTEKEVDIIKQEDKCVIHKGEIKGINYVCPKCKAKYCLKCASTLMRRGESCWICDTNITMDIESSNKLKLEDEKINFNNLINSSNPIEELLKHSDIEMTAIPNEIKRKLDKLNLDKNELDEILKDLVVFNTQEQLKIIEKMLEIKNSKKLGKRS